MDKQIVIGAIIAPHGVRGEFRVLPLTETPELFLRLPYILLDDGRKFVVVSARVHKKVYLIKVEGIDTMDDAELLRGHKVMAESVDLPPLKKDQYYVSDLLGFEAYDEAANLIGILKDIIETGSNDVFVIASAEGKETLVPALKVNIKHIDVLNKRISVILPEWVD